MKPLLFILTSVLLISCDKLWDKPRTSPEPEQVMGSKPIYAAENTAKQITYLNQKKPIYTAGNIYAYGSYIFQADVGRGIHVIDNSVPANADRIGFITVNGCAQMSIRGSYLYTNSYADLVTIDISDPANVREIHRVKNAFPEFGYNYPLSLPDVSGYYVCPRYDSVVVGWKRELVSTWSCYRP